MAGEVRIFDKPQRKRTRKQYSKAFKATMDGIVLLGQKSGLEIAAGTDRRVERLAETAAAYLEREDLESLEGLLFDAHLKLESVDSKHSPGVVGSLRRGSQILVASMVGGAQSVQAMTDTWRTKRRQSQ